MMVSAWIVERPRGDRRHPSRTPDAAREEQTRRAYRFGDDGARLLPSAVGVRGTGIPGGDG